MKTAKRFPALRTVEALRKRLSAKKNQKSPEWRDCACDLLQVLDCGCDLFNYRAIKLVTYAVWMCLNRSCTQCVCEKYIDWQLQLTFDNFLRFSVYRLNYSTLFMSTIVCPG